MKLRERSLKTVPRKSFTRGLPPARKSESEKRWREGVKERRERAREDGEIRNNIVPRRDPSGKLPGGAPPAAFLETKRKLEETGGDWFQPVARRGGRAGGDPLSP